MNTTHEPTLHEMRRAAYLTAAMGALFAILFLVSMWLLRSAPDANSSDQTFVDFYASNERRKMIVVGLYLLPLASVAFVWFTSALREWITRTGRRGSSLFATVQLMAGFGFITLTLTSAAASIMPAAITELSDNALDPEMARDFPLYGNALLLIFGVRMAAIFVMTTTKIGHATGLLPRWFFFLSVAIALILFLSYSLSVWLVVLFPLWVLGLCGMVIVQVHSATSGILRPLPESSSPSSILDA